MWRGEVVVTQSGRIQIEEVRVGDQKLVEILVSIALAYCGGIWHLPWCFGSLLEEVLESISNCNVR